MSRLLASFGAGVLFAVGLAISGMTQPSKVVGFLDFTGEWDPSLVFVMGAAVGVTFILFRLSWRRGAPLFAPKFQLPTRRDIDGRLIAGSALFGAGWGLGGFCPGPVLSSVATGAADIFIFLASMSAGMYGLKLYDRLRRSAASGAKNASSTSVKTQRVGQA